MPCHRERHCPRGEISQWCQRPNVLPGEVRMTNSTAAHAKNHRGHRPYFAHMLRIFSIPVVLFWIAFAVVVNVIAPQLEVVGELHSAPMAPEDAPSMIAMKRMGANFGEFDSNSTVMIVVEGQQALGPDAHKYYDEIIRKL